MDKHVCMVCRKDTKGGTYTGPAGHSVVIKTRRLAAAEVCLECYIIAHLPRDYQRRERYENGNATCRPATGVAWLDEGVCRMRGAPTFVFLGEVRFR